LQTPWDRFAGHESRQSFLEAVLEGKRGKERGSKRQTVDLGGGGVSFGVPPVFFGSPRLSNAGVIVSRSATIGTSIILGTSILVVRH